MARFPTQPLWLCLYFYELPLDQLRLGDSLAAIADKQRIVFASKAARTAGICPGMRLATAFALQPDIKVVERKPETEAQALEQLTEWCYQFTPTVGSYKDFSVLLDVGGSLTLFKGLNRLLQQIDLGLAHRGYHHSKGLAHTREAAWLFSHYRLDHGLPLSDQEINPFSPPDPRYWLRQLRSLPLAYLDIGRKQQQQLFNMGFGTLGDLMNLPKAELGRRFGRGLLDTLAAITGEQPAADFAPAHSFNAQVDFPNGLSKIDELQGPMENLLAQLMNFLHQQHLHTREVEWSFYYFRKPCDRLLIHTSPANNTLDSLSGLSRLKLEGFKLKAPVESLVLTSQSFTPAVVSSGDLFPELSHPSNQLKDYRQLLDKLLTRMGDGALSTVSFADEHLPEFQHQATTISNDYIDELRTQPKSEMPAIRGHLPLWLTEKPLPIGTPDESGGPLRLIYGPQRIDSHWWQERCRRDYYVARHKNGCYCWVFRDLEKQRWYLHGFYG